MNKFNKGKLIGVVAASLSAVSLMGVGFASWIINGTTPADTGNINVEVGTIDDQRIKVVGSPTITGQLSFDAAQDSEGKITSTANHETLSFSVNYQVEVKNSALDFKVDATWTPGTHMNSFLNEKSYISSPFKNSDGNDIKLEVAGKEAKGTAGSTAPDTHVTTTGFHTDAPTVSTADDVTTYTCKTTFYFGWGTAFNSMNPVYEGGLGTDGIINALTELQSLKNETFTITLTPSVVTTTGN